MIQQPLANHEERHACIMAIVPRLAGAMPLNWHILTTSSKHLPSDDGIRIPANSIEPRVRCDRADSLQRWKQTHRANYKGIFSPGACAEKPEDNTSRLEDITWNPEEGIWPIAQTAMHGIGARSDCSSAEGNNFSRPA